MKIYSDSRYDNSVSFFATSHGEFAEILLTINTGISTGSVRIHKFSFGMLMENIEKYEDDHENIIGVTSLIFDSRDDSLALTLPKSWEI